MLYNSHKAFGFNLWYIDSWMYFTAHTFLINILYKKLMQLGYEPTTSCFFCGSGAFLTGLSSTLIDHIVNIVRSPWRPKYWLQSSRPQSYKEISAQNFTLHWDSTNQISQVIILSFSNWSIPAKHKNICWIFIGSGLAALPTIITSLGFVLQDISKKLGDGQQPRFPEDEGMYIGVRPNVQSKMQNKLENRSVSWSALSRMNKFWP